MLKFLVRFFITCGNNASLAWIKIMQATWFIGETGQALYYSVKNPKKIRRVHRANSANSVNRIRSSSFPNRATARD